jgi:hypothetical protein
MITGARDLHPNQMSTTMAAIATVDGMYQQFEWRIQSNGRSSRAQYVLM